MIIIKFFDVHIVSYFLFKTCLLYIQTFKHLNLGCRKSFLPLFKKVCQKQTNSAKLCELFDRNKNFARKISNCTAFCYYRLLLKVIKCILFSTSSRLIFPLFLIVDIFQKHNFARRNDNFFWPINWMIFQGNNVASDHWIASRHWSLFLRSVAGFFERLRDFMLWLCVVGTLKKKIFFLFKRWISSLKYQYQIVNTKQKSKSNNIF